MAGYAASTASPLNGKVVCGHCGHIMRISCTKNAAFHCWFTRSAEGVACHRLHILRTELEKADMNSIKCQAKNIMAAGCLLADIGTPQTPAVIEHEAKIENLQDEKQRLYEALVLGDICQDEYKAKKATADAELNRTRSVLEVIRTQYNMQTPDLAAVDAAKLALENRALTQELSDILIDRVLIYPDSRIEIKWKFERVKKSL